MARPSEPLGSKRDFNDLHRLKGLDAVNADIQAAVLLAGEAPINTNQSVPFYARDRSPKTNAEKRLKVTEEARRLNGIVNTWVREHAGQARARRELQWRFESLEVEFGHDKEALAKAQNKARSELQTKLGLETKPSAYRRSPKQADDSHFDTSKVQSNIALSRAQGIGKSAAFFGGPREPGLSNRL